MTDSTRVRISESYKNYAPPANAYKIVSKLLSRVPREYLNRLDCVVLTNLAGQPRRIRLGKVKSRGRRVSMSRALGRYHPAWKGHPAWIELFIDQILNQGRKLIWIPFVRDYLLAKTLYHEIGHHIHCTVRPEYREREDVADRWGRKFTVRFLRKKYWYLVPPLKLLSWTKERLHRA